LLAVDDVYVMDGSMRSARADAFVSGLGRTRKVVPFDTLIEKHGIEGTVAVVAHEVGHAVHRHVPTCLAGNLATIALTLSHPAPVDRIRAIDARS
jgi:STE24 endopeptidase